MFCWATQREEKEVVQWLKFQGHYSLCKRNVGAVDRARLRLLSDNWEEKKKVQNRIKSY